MEFEWDPNKAARNLAKHQVSFHEAASVFGDPLSMTYPDPDRSLSEPRHLSIGLSTAGKVLVVVHTDRDERIRLISAREATRRERRYYEERRKERS